MKKYTLTTEDRINIINDIRDYVQSNIYKNHDSFTLCGKLSNDLNWTFRFNGFLKPANRLTEVMIPLFWDISVYDDWDNNYDLGIDFLTDIFDNIDQL